MISALFFFARVTAIMLKFWEAAFFALDAMVLLRYLAGITRRLPRWVGVLPLLALAAMIAYIRALVISGGGLFLIFAGPAIVVTVVLFLATLPRLFLNSRAPAERGKTVKMLAAFAGLCLVVFSAERVIELRIMVAGQPRFESIRKESRQTDLRSMGWGKSFVALKEKLAVEYPFTQWKGIDWEARYSTFAPRIAQAEAAHDRRAYYLTLREFAYGIPDGHIRLQGDDDNILRQQEAGGEYGLGIIEMSDGRVLVNRVRTGGPAEQAGIQAGDELRTWNGQALRDALSDVPVVWSNYPPATNEGKRLEQAQLLARASVGAKVTVTFRRPSDPASGQKTAQLAAVPLEDRARRANPLYEFLFSSAIETRMMANCCGYAHIKHEIPTLFSIYPERRLAKLIAQVREQRLPGLILDVRGNTGGLDGMVPAMLGFFHSESRVYEIPGVLNHVTGRFEASTVDTLRLLPREPYYNGRIAVLVDAETISSGEGIPLMLKGRPNVAIFGFHGTQGSFAINDKTVLLPEGIAMAFPQAQSLDANQQIQIDSNANGRGGVEPDHRIVLGDAEFDAQFRQGRDVVLEEAIKWLKGGQ